MHTIALFATKGGAGRTTVVKALASGFLATGRQVMVLDATGPGGGSMHPWDQAMQRSGPAGCDLYLCKCTLDDLHDTMAWARSSGIDVVLIDTAARPGRLQLEALGQADLFVVPFNGVRTAAEVAAGVEEHLTEEVRVMGLVTGMGSPHEAAQARTVFDAAPVLRTELPRSPAFAGELGSGQMSVLLHEAYAATVKARRKAEVGTGLSRLCEIARAWQATVSLTAEVQWALDGLRLEAPAPDDGLLDAVQRWRKTMKAAGEDASGTPLQ